MDGSIFSCKVHCLGVHILKDLVACIQISLGNQKEIVCATIVYLKEEVGMGVCDFGVQQVAFIIQQPRGI